MTIYSLLHSFNPILFLEVVRSEQAEVVVWVNVIQCEDKVYQCPPAVSVNVWRVSIFVCRSCGDA